MGKLIIGIIIGVVVTVILWQFIGPVGLIGLGASAFAFLGG
jgi:hypothetical protein